MLRFTQEPSSGSQSHCLAKIKGMVPLRLSHIPTAIKKGVCKQNSDIIKSVRDRATCFGGNGSSGQYRTYNRSSNVCTQWDPISFAVK